MAYATKQDLQKRLTDVKLVQLTDFAHSGAMDEARITAALHAAGSLIDSYVAGRYTLPLTVSDQVKDLSVDLAIYKLHAGRQFIPDTVKEDYNRALALLKDVSAGRASFDQPARRQASGQEVKTKDHASAPDVFDKDRLEGY